MPAKLILIWDYDTPIARITTTRPYNYDFKKCLDEANNVDTILSYAATSNTRMTFAVVGFGAEESVEPFDVRGKVQKIYQHGHEIASHSWKHEWFPYLTKYQIEKSLERSKFILEKCLNQKGCVKGFVPPHDRPTSWPSKLAFSLGDRALYPFHPGASIGYILGELKKQEYAWCRASYRSIVNKVIDWKGGDFENRLRKTWQVHNGIVHFRGTYMGFDAPVYSILEKAVRNSLPVVIVGHPAGLTINKVENIKFFDAFMKTVEDLKKKGDLTTHSVSDYIEESGITRTI